MNMLSKCAPVAICVLVAFAHAQTTGLQDLPDDVRATVKRELARKNTMARDQGYANDSKTAASEDPPAQMGDYGQRQRQRQRDCTMNVGTQEKSAPGRKQVVVFTKPVVQLCK